MLKLIALANRLAICRFPPGKKAAKALSGGAFYCEVRTPEETSIVCEEARVPAGVQAQRGWRALRVVGTLDFGLTGILSSIAAPLAREKISIFAVSTFDTDYILVKEEDLPRAFSALTAEGFSILG